MEIRSVCQAFNGAFEQLDLLLLEHDPSFHDLDGLAEAFVIEEATQRFDGRGQRKTSCEADDWDQDDRDPQDRRDERGEVDGCDLHDGFGEGRGGVISRHGVFAGPRKQHGTS